MISRFNELNIDSLYGYARWTVPKQNQTVNTRAMTMEPEIPHQFTISPYVKSTFALNSAEFGHAQFALMQENRRKLGLVVTVEDIADRQRAKVK